MCGCAPGNRTWNGRCATTLDAGSEVALSANERIRHVTIARANSAAPRTDFDAPLEWRVAGPTTTEHFSAVCYYFVRELQKTVNVPQGIVSSNWGGSRIEPWMSEAALRPLPGYQQPLELLGEYRANKPVAFSHWGEIWQKWWNEQRAVTRRHAALGGRRRTDPGWTAAPADLGYWENWNVPELGRYDGMMWFRARVTLDKAPGKAGARSSRSGSWTTSMSPG